MLYTVKQVSENHFLNVDAYRKLEGGTEFESLWDLMKYLYLPEVKDNMIVDEFFDLYTNVCSICSLDYPMFKEENKPLETTDITKVTEHYGIDIERMFDFAVSQRCAGMSLLLQYLFVPVPSVVTDTAELIELFNFLVKIFDIRRLSDNYSDYSIEVKMNKRCLDIINNYTGDEDSDKNE